MAEEKGIFTLNEQEQAALQGNFEGVEAHLRFGVYLAALMKIAQVTNPQLGKHCSLSDATISKWRTGQTIPNDEAAQKIIDFLGEKLGAETFNAAAFSEVLAASRSAPRPETSPTLIVFDRGCVLAGDFTGLEKGHWFGALVSAYLAETAIAIGLPFQQLLNQAGISKGAATSWRSGSTFPSHNSFSRLTELFRSRLGERFNQELFERTFFASREAAGLGTTHEGDGPSIALRELGFRRHNDGSISWPEGNIYERIVRIDNNLLAKTQCDFVELLEILSHCKFRPPENGLIRGLVIPAPLDSDTLPLALTVAAKSGIFFLVANVMPGTEITDEQVREIKAIRSSHLYRLVLVGASTDLIVAESLMVANSRRLGKEADAALNVVTRAYVNKMRPRNEIGR